jgi:DHA2 family multidrug resistance protein-like MFS transporter
MTAPTTTSIRLAGPREWIGLAVLALPTLLLSLDITVLHLAVPHLAADLAPTGTQLLWILDIYGFMVAGFLITMGVLGDRIGRRRLLLIGAAAFGVASVAAALSTSAEMLIASRALLGIAGATLMPSTLALISSMFEDPRQRGLAIGIWATMFSVGIAIGPVVGGALLEQFPWGSVFLLGVPVMALLLIAGPLLLPEHRDPNGGRVDIASATLAITSLLAIVLALKEFAAHGFALLPIVALGAGLLLAAAFARRQGRLDEPMLDLRLFRDRRLRAALLSLLVATAAVGGVYLFITQYLQIVSGLSPMAAGLWLLPAAATLIVTSLTAPLLARRVRPGLVVAVALLVSAVGFAVLAQVEPSGGLGTVVTGFVLVYAGVGPVTALGTDLVVGSAPPAKAGAAAALSETSTEVGVGLGLAVLGSVGAAVYRLGVSGHSDSDGGASAEALETLAGAMAAAGESSTPAAADALAESAMQAFADGFSAAAWVAGVALVITAGLVARGTRNRRGD